MNRSHHKILCLVVAFVSASLVVHGAYNLASREFTIGVGAAASDSHIRNFTSREFTIGVGQESVDLFPFDECLAGVVTIKDGSQFLEDSTTAIVSLQIKCGDTVIQQESGMPLSDFLYRWDTASLDDGIYTVVYTISRAGRDDVSCSRDYRLINQDYQGNLRKKFDLPLGVGWNLVSMPFQMDVSLLPADCRGFVYDKENKCFTFVKDPIPAGWPLWVFSKEATKVSLTSDRAVNVGAALSTRLKKGWNLVGVCGTMPLDIDCEDMGIDCIMYWNAGKYMNVPKMGTIATLKPQVGYWVYVND